MKKNQLGLIILLIIGLIPIHIFSQAIIQVSKSDHKILNKLEELKVNLCFEMNDYVVVSPQTISLIDDANINYKVLTSDHQINPLYIISAKSGVKLKSSPYLDEIIIDDDIRVEKTSAKNQALLPQQGIKFIPVKISSKLYQNKSSKVSKQSDIDLNISRDLDEVLESVNADSIAWFIQNLEDFGSRFALLPNRRQVSEWIASQFTRFGYTNVAIDSFYVANYDTWQYNVVCIEEGAIFPDQYLVIGGHHDSIITPNIDDAYTYAPGADDNASGVSAVLETARILKLNNVQLQNSIRFVTFAMEEFGLYGGYHDAEYLAENDVNVVAMLNSDMISNCTTDDYIFTLRAYPGAQALTNHTLQNSIDLDMTTYSLNTSINASDSWPYHVNGFDAVFFAEYEFSPYYHSDQDTSENTNPDYAAQFIKLIATTAISVGNTLPSADNFIVEDTGDGTSVNAYWDELNLWGVDYHLLVKNADTGDTESYYTDTNTYTIEGLLDDTPYEITLYTQVGEYSSFGVTRFITPQSTPRVVESFSYQPLNHEISFSWQANSELDLAGYKIYRKEENQTEFAQIASVTSDLTSYIDSSTEDLIWYDYVITAFDEEDNESEYSEVLRARHLSFNSGIGIFDFTSFSEANLLFPQQSLVEEFYAQVFSNYDYDLIITSPEDEFKLESFGIYSSVIIFKNSFSTNSNSDLAIILDRYAELGGNVLISASDPLRFLGLNAETYPAEFTGGDIAYNLMGINEVDNNSTARFARGQSMTWDISDLEVEPEKIYPAFNNRIFNLEAFSTINDASVQNILSYQSDLETSPQNSFDDYIVAVSKTHDTSKVIVTSLPLYFIKTHQAQAFIEAAMGSFAETVDNEDNEAHVLTSSLNLSNYPNPFNPTTTIKFTLPTKGDISLKIYNVKGQLVKSFYKNNLNPGLHDLTWHGDDNQGNTLSSGLYLYRLNTESGISETKRMVLLK